MRAPKLKPSGEEAGVALSNSATLASQSRAAIPLKAQKTPASRLLAGVGGGSDLTPADRHQAHKATGKRVGFATVAEIEECLAVSCCVRRARNTCA